MNREIKFRGKKVMTGEWIFGSLVITRFKDDPKLKYYIALFLGNYSFDWEVIPESVGQFTGLYDKNGKEIYEGDVIKVHSDHTYIAPVVFNQDKCSFQLAHKKGYHGAWGITRNTIGTCDYEIIGNIYENPELIVSEDL